MPVQTLSKTEEKLIEFLKAGGFLSQEYLAALQEESQRSHRPFEELLLERGDMKDKDLGGIMADVHGWDFVNLKKEMIPETVIRRLNEEEGKKYQALVFEETPKGFKVAMAHPDDKAALEWLEKKLNAPVLPYFATPRDLASNRIRYQPEIEEEFARLIEAHSHEAVFGEAKDSAVVKLVDLLLSHGYKKRASDIHIEPQEMETMVRFRLDGILHDIVKIPKNIHELVITRLKVMAHLRTDEHQAPQDGKIAFPLRDEIADIRVSVVPTTKGENAVLRLLSEKSRQLTLEDLGLLPPDHAKLSHSIKKPWGMILVTGPTGSGKTTTLYGILKILNDKAVNIATIEDPVEYNIDGVTQIQVNPKARLTFASGLRSLVRQDPDIIMVGEIRDAETADIAVNSAMTGHLVLSTLHTNDAPTTLPRLLEMGVEPFLIASTVNLIVAQRLVRRICTNCIMSVEVDARQNLHWPEEVIKKMPSKKGRIVLYKGAGCSLCGHTGFLGRVGVYELLEVTEIIRELIMKRTDADTVKKEALRQGMTTMLEDGLKKVLQGLTTMEEVLRVIKD